ncbi:hypothetical protein DCD75_18475, partial [Acinetobacter baumannii]
LVLPVHPVHVRRRGAHVGDIAGKVRQFIELAHLFQDGRLASRRDELSLVQGDGAEIASAEASPVVGDGEPDLPDRRDAPHRLVHRVVGPAVG